MCKFKCYHVGDSGLVEGEALGRITVYLAADFDRVHAERDALQARLTVQDQREDDLKALLFFAYERLSKVRYMGLRKRINATLNPAVETASHEE